MTTVDQQTITDGLALRGLRAGYGTREVVHGIDLDVPAGGCAVLLGANGAGKSTTLNAIMGRVDTFAGTVHVGGELLDRRSAANVVRQGVSLVPEGGRVFRDLSVEENLRLGAFAHRGPVNLDAVHGIFPLLRDRARQLAGSLSGGERQMLAIGRALVGRPRVLMLDEPFLGLAPVAIDAVVAALRRVISDLGVTVLLVEQNLKALKLADVAYLFALGEVAHVEADPRRLLDADTAEVEDIFFGG
jgi:branched-chain amino acid transport system ATP-binding protein